MEKFRVDLSKTITASMVVYADSQAEAEEIALEEAPQTDFGFSHFDGGDDWSADQVEATEDPADDWFDQRYEDGEDDD